MSGQIGAIDEGSREENAEDVIQRLIDEFGVSLEESLIRAMASDHEDYDIAGSYNVIRNQLLPLAEIAAAEEATGFDPSGLSSAPDAVGLGLDDTTTDDTNPVSQSSVTELTASNSDSSDNPEGLRFTDEADLSEDEKIDNLMMIFSNFKAHTIKFVLKQTGGDLERAFDELLNRQFLDESGELAKGVEGFYYLPSKETARRKGERSVQQRTRGTKLEVDYCVPLHLPDVDELEGEKGSVKLQHRPSTLSPKSIPPRIVAGPSHPHTLRVNLPNSHSSHQDQRSDVPRPSEKGWQVVTGKKRTVKPATVVPDVTRQSASSSIQTAAALSRKGPLYRQGAVVYTERIGADVRAARASQADHYRRLVHDQSTPLKTDLHGVPVLDGVRIAKDRVQRWWETLDQEERERKKAAHGFTVVTGVGYHSSGGFSRLRQAVGAALKNSGWKVEDLTGEFLVTGRT